MLYIAAENIPAGHYVHHRDPGSDKVYDLDPLRIEDPSPFKICIGVARENLREGFRVCVRGDGIYEDDA